MRFGDTVRYSMKSLRQRQARSWLTVLGIVIGIAAVVSLITIGEGFNREVEKQLGKLGANTVFISPQAGSAASSFSPHGATAGKIYDKDVERLKRVPEISEIARLAIGRGTAEFKGKQIDLSIYGIEPGVFEKTTDIDIEEGRFLLDSDRRVAVVGNSVAEDMFGSNKKVGVGSYLTINGIKFRVIGVIQEAGAGFGMAGQMDNMVLVHFEDARGMFREILGENEVGALAILVREGADVAEAVDRMKAEMDASHKVSPDERDYSVTSPETMQESVGTVLSLITAFLGAVASISLIVGALAIASGMFTSVIERTHEIGVLKSVGASEDDILRIFLLESGAVGGIGGTIGAAVGVGAVMLGSLFGLPNYINPGIALFGVAFAFLIGIVSGYLPARQAARLSPVDALRYE